MRISEKTIEINFCSQFAALMAPNYDVVWFGLTQRQESRAGFDVLTRLNSRVLIFQVKTLHHEVLNRNALVYSAPHGQLQALRDRCRAQRSIQYVFPTFRTTHDFPADPFGVLKNVWLCDVAQLPAAIPQPIKLNGQPRRGNSHRVEVIGSTATFYSEPFKADLRRIQDDYRREWRHARLEVIGIQDDAKVPELADELDLGLPFQEVFTNAEDVFTLLTGKGTYICTLSRKQ